MRKILEKLGLAGPDAEARQLNTDADRILVSVEGQYGAETQARIARLLREHRDRVHALSLANTQHYDQGLKHLQDVNAEMRRENDQPAWSAVTLAIIYLRAELAGARAAPARSRIDEFLSRFRFEGEAAEEPLPAAQDAAEDTAEEGPARTPAGRRPWRS